MGDRLFVDLLLACAFFFAALRVSFSCSILSFAASIASLPGGGIKPLIAWSDVTHALSATSRSALVAPVGSLPKKTSIAFSRKR